VAKMKLGFFFEGELKYYSLNNKEIKKWHVP
jgi:hypothetical protein